MNGAVNNLLKESIRSAGVRVRNAPSIVKKHVAKRYGGSPKLHKAAPGLDQWWSKHYRINGEVIQHLAPNEIHIMGPFIKKIPKRLWIIANNHWLDHVIPATIVFAALYWAKSKVDMEHYHHRY